MIRVISYNTKLKREKVNLEIGNVHIDDRMEMQKKTVS